LTEAVDDFGNSPSSRTKEGTSSCLTVKFANRVKADIHEFLDSHASELKEEILEQVTPLSEPDNENE
jgi:hypothetical protein